MRILFTIVIATVMLMAGAAGWQPVHAIDVFPPCGGNNSAVCKATGNDKLFGAGGTWNKVLNLLTFFVGAIAVIMIIVGGLRYTLSGGDPSGVSSAKNTIIYALVGLVLATMGNAIINFVLTNI